MVNKRVKILLLSTALIGMPFWGIKAFDWLPVGDLVGDDGFAYATGLVYEEGDRVINTGEIPGEEGELRSPKNKKRKGAVSKRFSHNMKPKARKTKTRGGEEGGEIPSVFNTQFEATTADGILDISGALNGTGAPCSLKVDGDVTLTAHDADMIVNIKTPVNFVPYIDPTGDAFGAGGSFTGTGFSQLYFDAAEGRVITVNMDHNLEFRGRTLTGSLKSKSKKMDGSVIVRGGEESGSTPIDMILTFKGKGQTVFKMADGTSIKFSGDIDGTNAVSVLDGNTFTNFSNNAAGTKVFITMENTAQEVSNGFNKVVFERASLGGSLKGKGKGKKAAKGRRVVDDSQRNLIVVGNNSIITYVATDVTGLAHTAEDATDEALSNFASVGFDPSNNGTGRMVLFLLGAYTFGFDEGFVESDPEFFQIIRKFPFNEGSVVVAGHRVAAYDPASIRETLNYSVPAGGQATFRVTDNKFYDARDVGSAYNPSADNRRGLLVINDNQSVTKHASDPYLDFFNGFTPGGEEELLRGTKVAKAIKAHLRKRMMGKKAHARGGEEGSSEIFGRFWSYSFGISDPVNTRNVRNGFVLGVNGALDVYHNAFFDYVAGSVNQTDLLAENDFASFVDSTEVNGGSGSLAIIKKKNPAAFIADGLDVTLFSNNLSDFQAANPTTQERPVNARINLFGNGAALFRACGSSREGVGYIFNFWKDLAPAFTGEEGEGAVGVNPLDNPTLDFNAALLLGQTAFDGYKLAANDDTRARGEGEHVVEVEGPLTAWSFPNTSIIDPATSGARNYLTPVSRAGVITMPTIEVDFRGNEVATRPLVRNSSYTRYNSPALFFNNNGQLVNTTLVHSDVTKFIDGVPATSDPAIVGGERFVFANATVTFDGSDRDRYRFPEIQLINGTVDLQESVNAAGVRFVVKDNPNLINGFAGQAGNNTSVIRFFDHGDANDTNFTGYGRIFMLGSLQNTMADGTTHNWINESGYFNVFKHNNTSLVIAPDTAAHVTLSLQTGNQFPSDVDALLFDQQRAHHLFLLSGMDRGNSNMAVGWSTVQGDSTNNFPYDNTTYRNDLVKEGMSVTPEDLFSLDALTVSPATVSLDGHFISFSSFDQHGAGVRTPITRADNKGVVYIRHGGRITITSDPLSGIPFETIIDTVVAQKIWNDYNDNGNERVQQLTGIIDLPHDQSTFKKGAGIQTYGFTQEMFDARADETSGYIRLSAENLGRAKADRSGAEELIVNWFNREGDNTQFVPTKAIKNMLKKMGPRTRATESITAPVEKPARLLYIGSNDDITQLAVAGATLSDPFLLEVSGDAVAPSVGRVREFATINRTLDMPTDHMVGEGAHAKIFVEYGGHVGLGTRDWNERSLNPWNIIGKDHVQIIPLGDGVIDLNQNLIVSDKQALVAGSLFGEGQVHRLTFYSQEEYEIRVPAGVELDLSSFGQGSDQQQIAFGGKTKLIIERGAGIRFPTAASVEGRGGVVLYFNDESQLIFEGTLEPEVFTTPFVTSDAANIERIKILGKGQIWGNKSGKIVVNGDVLVGVQSDTQTPETDVVISLQRDAQFNIGTSTQAGGAFEVGNPSPVAGGSINFTLQNFGGQPKIHIDRRGFLGLGAGVIDKHGNINGAAVVADNPVLAGALASLDADGFPVFTPNPNPNVTGWTIQPLNDVNNIDITLRTGSFEHNNIADGSLDNASLIAVGPATSYRFRLSGPADVAVLGGGNVMNVPAGAAPFSANVWDFASPLPGGEQYSILPSAPLLLDRGAAEDLNAPVFRNGKSFTFDNQADFFNLLAFKPILDHPSKKTAIGRGTFGLIAGFVNANINATDIYPVDTDKVVRIPDPVITAPARAEQGLATGALIARSDGDIDPATFSPIE